MASATGRNQVGREYDLSFLDGLASFWVADLQCCIFEWACGSSNYQENHCEPLLEVWLKHKEVRNYSIYYRQIAVINFLKSIILFIIILSEPKTHSYRSSYKKPQGL